MPAKQKRAYGRVRAAVSEIARERIQILLREAKKSVESDPEIARRYAALAKKVSMRTKVRIPREEKRYVCKACGIPLVPGRNARVRILACNSRIVVTCLACGAFKRYPFSKRRI